MMPESEAYDRVAYTQRKDAQELSRWIGSLVGKPIQIAIANDRLWLRYSSRDEQVTEIESHLPVFRFRLDPDDRLIPLGKEIAVEILPSGLDWLPIDQLISWDLPVAAMSGVLPNMEWPQLELVSGGSEQPVVGGLFQLADLAKWIDSAAQFRLKSLTYVVDMESSLVLILGEPLPPLSYQPLWQTTDILLPAGQVWSPQVTATTVRAALGAASDQLVVWLQSDDWSVIAKDAFMPVSRSSIRSIMPVDSQGVGMTGSS